MSKYYDEYLNEELRQDRIQKILKDKCDRQIPSEFDGDWEKFVEKFNSPDDNNSHYNDDDYYDDDPYDGWPELDDEDDCCPSCYIDGICDDMSEACEPY